MMTFVAGIERCAVGITRPDCAFAFRFRNALADLASAQKGRIGKLFVQKIVYR